LRTLLLLFVVAASSLGAFGAAGIVVFLVVVGVAIFLREAESPIGLVHFLLLLLCLGCLISLLMPAVQIAREAGRKAQCLNNLKQIALALLAYHEAKGRFPPVFAVDNNGKPMHSWRTRILPYLDSSDPSKAYDFTKPWDTPQNKGISAARLMVYECPSEPRGATTGTAARTNYFAVVGTNTVWADDQPSTAVDFGKYASHTILLVEVAGSGVAWAEPRDFSLDALGVVDSKSRVSSSSNHRPPDSFFYAYDRVSGVGVAMADGSVGFLRTDNLSPDELRKILQVSGYTDDVRNSQGDHYAGRRLNWPNIAALAVWLVSVGTLLSAAVRSRKARFALPLAG